MRKPRKADRLKFIAGATAIIESLGGTPGTYYDWQLETLYGTLHLSVISSEISLGWLATRFEDFERSKGIHGGPFTAKWNFHFHPSTSAGDSLAEICRELERVTGREVPQEIAGRLRASA